MGNSKHSTVVTTMGYHHTDNHGRNYGVHHHHNHHQNEDTIRERDIRSFILGIIRWKRKPHKQIVGLSSVNVNHKRKSDADDYAGVQLGRLRSVDFKVAHVLIQSSSLSQHETLSVPSSSSSSSSSSSTNSSSLSTKSNSTTRSTGGLSINKADGLLLDKLWNANTFLFTRTCERNHSGFGFSCDISLRLENGERGGLYVVRQPKKPKKRFQGMEDSPLDIYDVTPHYERQVLGLVLKKTGEDNPTGNKLEGLTVFTIQGVLGHVNIKEDWTDQFLMHNSDGQLILKAQRFNRLSGGMEFQISHSTTTNDTPRGTTTTTNSSPLFATLVRLEESKFILKLYTSCAPLYKGLSISFTIMLMYLMSR